MNRDRNVRCCLFILLATWAADSTVLADQKVIQIGRQPAQSAVPKWNLRGSDLLPWQGIACADMSPDGALVAVGTIAPPGDPNVFVLNRDGALRSQHTAGQRWISHVDIADRQGTVLALSTTPLGQAGDRPIPYLLSTDKSLDAAWGKRLGNYDPLMFHYGDHSNHLGVLLQTAGDAAVLIGGNQVLWLYPQPGARTEESQFRCGPDSAVTAAAVNPAGRVALGLTAALPVPEKSIGNLIVAEPQTRQPLWSRPPWTETDPPAAMEPGLYGPPAPKYEDRPLWAPLAVAIDRSGQRVAAADYQGYERRFLPRGLRRAQSYGVRFMPARPAIQVYDAEGQLLRRWEPTTFAEPFWCDLSFSADGRTLIVVPHSWTCRGLAGQPILPADATAQSMYLLDIASGDVTVLRFPDAIADLAQGGELAAVACWNGQVYLFDSQWRPVRAEGLPVGGPALVRVSADGQRILAAATRGVVHMFSADGRQLWQTDLKGVAKPGDKPWTKNQKAGSVAPGIWTANTGRAHSDLGGQYVIEAPQGLILIDPNAGLSIEQNWARIAGAGLDPRQVRYVLLTHEHGDHAPGAYLWRVLTGAQVVASAEIAYTLQHHIPNGTGYGFHPPVPVDIALKEDGELDLAGLKVRGVRLPGHTYGSMGWMFDKDGKKYVAIGDLIMPGGVLGYSGSINFSPDDVLASLEKLGRLQPDAILPGHGPTGDPAPYLKGIEVGEATGWGKMTPRKPDPFYGFASRDYLVVGWLENIQSSAFGDVDGDGRPDVALLTSAAEGSEVKIYLNQGGRFGQTPDGAVAVPEIDPGFKLRMGHVNADRAADFLVSSESTAVLLVSEPGKLKYRTEPLPGLTRATQFLTGDASGDGQEYVVGGRFVGQFSVFGDRDARLRPTQTIKTAEAYFDLARTDFNGDGRADVITSGGEVFLRGDDGRFPETPDLRLPRPGTGWTFMAVDDFNGDRRPDVALVTGEARPLTLSVFYHTGDAKRPLTSRPSATFELPANAGVLRDGPTTGDWNGDGIADLLLGTGQEGNVFVLLGAAPAGLSLDRTATLTLDYRLHFDTRIGVADFNGDGRADLAGFGTSAVGAPAVYIRLQEARHDILR